MLVTVKGQHSTRKSSESSYGSDVDNKSQRVITRRLSFKPVRILARIPTFKSKNSSMERGHQISQSPDTRLLRATCSSALKDSHFPDHIEIPQEEGDSEEVSAVGKVCPYSYCSLHGHRHGNLPPLKRFVSMRRRTLKSQKPTKMNQQPVTRSNQFGNVKKATQKTHTVHSEGGKSHFQNKKKLARDSCIRPHDTPESTVTESVESASTDGVEFSAPGIEISEGEVSSTGKNMEPDHEVLEVSASTTDKKYISMWQLVYKHAVLSDTGKCENKQPFDEREKEGREQDFLATNEVNNSNCGDGCDTDQDMDDENKNVIELVQKAFDEILLPEPEELFSDDNSKSEGADSDEVLSEKSAGQREWKTSESTDSPIIAQRTGTKSDQRAPKSWSNLKKLILWKRFVKALEKARNIHPQRPRYFPSDANSEMEKVFLKHQTAEGRKHAEEWMLDYALQKVISKLAPAQRRRVTLLVEAFETVQPFQDVENGTRFSATTEPQSNPIQSLDNSSNHSKEEASLSHNRTMELAVSTGDDPMIEMQNPTMLKERCLDYSETEPINNMPAFGDIGEDLNGKQCLASSYDDEKNLSSHNDNIFLGKIKDNRSSSLNKPTEFTSSHVDDSTNAVVNDVSEDLLSSLNSENQHIKSESPGVETKNMIGDDGEKLSMSKSLIVEGLVRSLRSNLIASGAPANLLDESSAEGKEGTEKAKLETETVEEFPTKEQSKAPTSAAVEPETPVEKQNNTGLWYLVYKHMVSNMAESNPKSLIDGEDEKESDGSRTRGSSISYEGTPLSDQKMQFKDHDVADPEVALQQIEAIKMVEEAIDSILPDDQDDLADKESFTGNKISDNSKQSDRTERVYSEGLKQKEEKMESGNEITQEQQEKSAPKEESKTNQPLSRSWSNLKKVILLRRFIKSLEKVRKFNPRGPRYLPLEPDSEAEKVNLRHQDMEERKGTEEWMLDYALRQVVSKLTPARKRKVELLVEAFETVMPTIKN